MPTPHSKRSSTSCTLRPLTLHHSHRASCLHTSLQMPTTTMCFISERGIGQARTRVRALSSRRFIRPIKSEKEVNTVSHAHSFCRRRAVIEKHKDRYPDRPAPCSAKAMYRLVSGRSAAHMSVMLMMHNPFRPTNWI